VRWLAAVIVGLGIIAAGCGGGVSPETTPVRPVLTDPRLVPTAEPWTQPPPVRYLEGSTPGAPVTTPTPESGTAGVCGDTYVVQAGDTLSAIARKCGVSLDDLLAANPQIKDPASIYPGQQIRIPR